jgi:hypothetical protein
MATDINNFTLFQWCYITKLCKVLGSIPSTSSRELVISELVVFCLLNCQYDNLLYNVSRYKARLRHK